MGAWLALHLGMRAHPVRRPASRGALRCPVEVTGWRLELVAHSKLWWTDSPGLVGIAAGADLILAAWPQAPLSATGGRMLLVWRAGFSAPTWSTTWLEFGDRK